MDTACSICPAIKGREGDSTWIRQEDIFYRDHLVMGFISSKMIAGNEGHALIVPTEHYDNLYEMPAEIGHRIFDLSKKVAIALKKLRKCDGVTLVQNNEIAGDQHAPHFHLHVIPRFKDDNFHTEFWIAQKCDPSDRIAYSKQLKDIFKE